MTTMPGRLGPTGSPVRRRRRSMTRTLTMEESELIDQALRIFDAGLTVWPKALAHRRLMLDQMGHLYRHELKAALRAFGFEIQKSDVLCLMDEHGIQPDDPIDAETFRAILSEEMLRRDPTERVRRCFELLDVDGTGKVHARGLKRLCKEIGLSVEDAEVHDMIDAFDRDQDGLINFADFEKIMTADSDSD